MVCGGSFLHIASEIGDVAWFSFCIKAVSVLSLHHIVCNHKSLLFLTLSVEVARLTKDRLNHGTVVASNYSQCPERCALIDYAYHLMSCCNPQPNNFF